MVTGLLACFQVRTGILALLRNSAACFTSSSSIAEEMSEENWKNRVLAGMQRVLG